MSPPLLTAAPRRWLRLRWPREVSPEQLMAGGQLDPRSDVYSLGATLWELLTLRPLLDVTRDTPTPQETQKILYEDPVSPRQHNPRVRPDLAAVVARCLEKRPERRYQTAHELSEDLARYQRGEPVVARPVSRLVRVARWAARHPARASAAALTLVLLIVLAAAVNIHILQRAEASTRTKYVRVNPTETSVTPRSPKYRSLTIATRMAEPFWANMTER